MKNVIFDEDECVIPTVNSQTSGSLRSSVDTFKRCLDKYLRMVPDEPHISRYTALRRAETVYSTWLCSPVPS